MRRPYPLQSGLKIKETQATKTEKLWWQLYDKISQADRRRERGFLEVSILENVGRAIELVMLKFKRIGEKDKGVPLLNMPLFSTVSDELWTFVDEPDTGPVRMALWF